MNATIHNARVTHDNIDWVTESPIERDFALMGMKRFKAGSGLRAQVPFKTYLSRRRVDFVVFVDGMAIGLECDGRDFHEDIEADRGRDADLVASGCLDAVYRIRGTDIWNHMEDLVYSLSVLEPALFDERSRGIALVEASPICERSWEELDAKQKTFAQTWIIRCEDDSQLMITRHQDPNATLMDEVFRQIGIARMPDTMELERERQMRALKLSVGIDA